MAYNKYKDKSKVSKPSSPKPLDIRWITGGIPIDSTAVNWTEEAGAYLVKCGLTTSSLRRFFGEARRIQTDFDSFRDDVQLLRAKLAYNANRKGKEGVEDFYNLVKDGIIAVEQDEQRFNKFIKLAEAIVAFHKVHGGAVN